MAGKRMTRKFSRFRALEARDRWMLLHATLWLAMARITLLVMPFRKLAALLSRGQNGEESTPDPELLDRIGYAIGAAAGNVPWRSDCFPQSIAGWMLLKHHGYNSTIHLGVQRLGDGELEGHAWLTCGDVVVTGGEALDRFVETHRLGG